MHDPVLVHVLHTHKYLLHESDSFSLIKPSSTDNVVEQLSPFCVLHDQMDISGRLNNLHAEGVPRRAG